MSRVLAWRSDADGLLFEDRSEYQAHLRKLAAKRRQQRKRAAMLEQRAGMIAQLCSVANIQELEEFIKSNWSWFYYNGVHNNPVDRTTRQVTQELVSIAIKNVRWCNGIDNMHHCPQSGVSNWYRKPDLPTKYAGWRCQLVFAVRPARSKTCQRSSGNHGFGSDYFANTPICTGTGGGGGRNDNNETRYSYSCILWADDFTVMREQHEKEVLWKELSGQNLSLVV